MIYHLCTSHMLLVHLRGSDVKIVDYQTSFTHTLPGVALLLRLHLLTLRIILPGFLAGFGRLAGFDCQIDTEYRTMH